MNGGVRDVKEARRRVGEIRRRMLRPSTETLDLCRAELELAADALRRAEPVLRWASRPRTDVLQDIRAELDRMRRDLAHVNALLTNAARFYTGWARLIAPTDGDANYTSGGAAAAPRMERQVVLRG